MAATFECRVLVLMIFVFLLVSKLGWCINLDARFSVIKQGPENSYFGYSVAQHMIADDANDDDVITPEELENIIENVLLVGAPKEKVESEGHKFGGALYRCNAANLELDDCQKITVGAYDPPRRGYVVDDQWFGVSVASAGKGQKAVACAHRYIKDNAATGYCVVFYQSLDGDLYFLRPCTSHFHNKYMEDFGLCQAGMSTAMGQEESLLMGAPGSKFWQGTVFLTNVSEEYGVSQTEITSPYIKDEKKLTGDEQRTPVPSYSYQGYSTDMGRFDGSRALYYVSGAPNANASGVVVFYRKIDTALRYEESQILKGKKPFSGFGSSLLAIDLNDDGYDDLIVGAPYYYKRNYGGAFYVYLGGPKMFTSDTEPTEVLSRQMGDEECGGLSCEHARFGISLSKLDDINMDGYQDFAVGAPYEGNGVVYIYHGDDSDAGFSTLYVQRIEASEVPIPDLMSFGYSLSGGMDLDGNGYPDLLVGAYESDTVALIRSRPIINLHPQISVRPNLIDLDAPPKCDMKNVLPEFVNTRCVEVKLCLNYTTQKSISLSSKIDIVYKLEAEKPRRIARVELQNAKDTNKKIVDGVDLPLFAGQNSCNTEIAFIKDSFDDKLNPITFTFSFSLASDSKPFPTTYPQTAEEKIDDYPILDTDSTSTEANTVPLEVDFVKECGDDNECFSNLQFTSQLLSPIDELENIRENEYEMVIKAKNELQLVLGVSNQGEPAYLTRIFVQKPSMVTFQGIELSLEQSTVTCNDDKDNDTLIICENIGNPLHTNKGVYFNMLLDIPREMAESEEMYTITTWVNTSSTETTPVNDRVEVKFKLINKAEISLVTNVVPDSTILCEGEPRGASAITDETKIGAAVQHNFFVSNAGPGVISESYITIYWPLEVADAKAGAGKYLLYLMRKPKITGPVEQCNDDEIKQYINPLKIPEIDSDGAVVEEATNAVNVPIVVDDIKPLSNGTESSSRTRREAESQRSKQQGDVIVMNCRDKSAKCFQFKCKLGKLEANADIVKITMDARLWESTLLSDYKTAAEVQMISWAELTLPSKLKIQQDTTNDQRRAITRAVPDYEEASKQGLQWWIILASVLAGIVLLLIVIFILYKLGFFRRKRPEEMQMYRAEKTTQMPMLKEYEDDEA